MEIKISKEVLEFADDMQKELDNNNNKGGWADCSPGYLRDFLEEEFYEVVSALMSGDVNEEKLISECADLANIAMMIADNTRKGRFDDYEGFKNCKQKESQTLS